MRIHRRRALTIVTCLLLLGLLATAAAADLTVEEAGLTASGQVYEVNSGPNGLLTLSDWLAQEIWRVDPATAAYTVYTGIYAQDARADLDGAIWWTDGAEVFGRIDPQTNVKTTWTAGPPGEVNLWGVSHDGDGNVWFSEWFGSSSRVYRFDPATGELCSFAPTGGVNSYYLLHESGQIWLGNWGAGKILRLDTTTNQLRAWQLPAGSSPVGMALDAAGNLWWADAPAGVPLRGAPRQMRSPRNTTSVGALARLEPDLDRLTTYTLPAGTDPQWLAVVDDIVWYSEAGGTVGQMDPALAGGTTSTLVAGDQALTPSCSTLGAGSSSPASSRTGTLAYTAGTWPTIVDGGGWTVYQMPAGSAPYGLAFSADTLWVGDQGRQKLSKRVESACYPFDIHPRPPACDGDVDIADIATVAGCFGQPLGAACPAILDFDGSGAVDVVDITLVADQWGWTAQPPEFGASMQ